MQLATERRPISKALWAGRVVSALVVLMLLADSVAKIIKAAPVLKAQTELGFPDSLTVGIGFVLLICTCVYAIPRTSILGANPPDRLSGRGHRSQTAHRRFTLRPDIFPAYIGIMAWGGLFLREDRLRTLIPLLRERRG